MYGQSADAYALAGAISLAALAALHALAWRTLRRRWCAAFALAFLLAALIYAFEPYTRSPGSRANPYTVVMAMPVLLLLIEGWIDHAALGARLSRALRRGGLAVALVTLAGRVRDDPSGRGRRHQPVSRCHRADGAARGAP